MEESHGGSKFKIPIKQTSGCGQCQAQVNGQQCKNKAACLRGSGQYCWRHAQYYVPLFGPQKDEATYKQAIEDDYVKDYLCKNSKIPRTIQWDETKSLC
jgi:hypothetical protein